MTRFPSATTPLAALAIIAIAAVGACGKTGTGSMNPVTPAVVPPATALQPATVVQPDTTVAVGISGYAFHPKTVRIKVGSTVKWTNHMKITHTVTANGGAFNSGDLAPGHSFSHMFKKTGKFPYHCMIHPFMTGSVIVSR